MENISEERPGSDVFSRPVGEMFEAPPRGSPGLNPSFKKGDRIRTLCRIQGGGGWWCGPYTVLYHCGDQPAYRPRYAKVDKVAAEWMMDPGEPTAKK